MNKSKFLFLTLGIIFLLLLGSCIYFYIESEKPGFNITIGTPVNEEITMFGEVIKDKKTADDIVLGLISAKSIDKPKISEKLPDAEIKIYNSKEKGICHCFIYVWIDKDQVIFYQGDKDRDDKSEYKITKGDFGKIFIEYISKYKYK